jgi:replication factor C subunit 2/4
LICNYVTRIIEPLASRCAKFRFRPLPVGSMAARMQHISTSEGVILEDGALDTILAVSLGDMRKAVTFLQSSFQLSSGEPVKAELVIDISGEVSDVVMANYWAVLSGRSFEAMRLFVEELIYQSHPVSSVLSKLFDVVVSSPSLVDTDRALICEKIAKTDQSLVDGASEALQMLDLSCFVMRRLSGISSSGADVTAAH